MSKGFDGVRPASESSIEIGFFYQGRHCVERLRVKPTAANLKRASDRRAAILAAIARGDFDYDAEFPKAHLGRRMTHPAALPLHDLTADAFKPYGWMLGKPMPQGNGIPLFSNDATDFWQEHVFNTGAGGDAEVLWVNYRSASADIASLEKHLLTQQAIVPLTGDIIQVVACSAADGSPDLSTLIAFRVAQGQGVCMRPGCWHATRVVGGEVTCLMLTRRSTTVDLIQHLTTDAAASESAITPIPPAQLEGLPLPG